jgi:tRNA nucleotidyltransferase (CCA-adding enzyme)
VFESVYDPLRSLADLLKSEDKQCKFLDKLMREGVLAPLSHFPTPATYPDLACAIIDEIPRIASILGIETVKHLPSLTPLLTGIMQDPFILSRKELTLTTILALQSVMEKCWPRIPAHRGAITLGLCVLKGRCDDESGRLPKGRGGNKEAREWSLMENILQTLKDTAGMLDTVLSQSEVSEEWVEEKKALVDADGGLEGFFEEEVQ